MMNPVIFREYDIRGVYQRDYDLKFVEDLGKAYIQLFLKKTGKKNPTITLGYDARLSSLEIEKALTRGITKSGGHVIHLGLITTPISYFSTFDMDNVDGAIIVTGSHNPPEYNGFKISVGKSTIFGEDIQTLMAIVEKKDFLSGIGTEETFNIFPQYLSKYTQEFKNLKKIKVVLDLGNGAAGCIARSLYEGCGLSPVIIFEKPDGTFPNHHPDPTVEENLEALKEKVTEVGAELGIGFDGDSDRIGLVDKNGSMVMGDEIIYLFAKNILKKNPNSKIIGDVKCSDRMYKAINRSGGKAIMWKTGHSLIKEKIKLEKAPFGGELSGHIFFSDRNYGYDDALYAGLRMIEIISETGLSIKEMLADMGHGYSTPEIRINTTEEKKVSIVEKIRDIYTKDQSGIEVNQIDGVRISYKDGWALARSSNTQPVLVLRFESETQEGLNRIQTEINNIVNPLL